MAKVAVVFWSGTGNTEAMADAIVEGAQAAGAEVQKIQVSSFGADQVAAYDALAFGCPSMGAEELEADEFEPVWDACVGELAGKPVVLFGSWGWGGGEWMDTWKDAAEAGGVTVTSTVLAENAPDDDALEACKAAGASLA